MLIFDRAKRKDVWDVVICYSNIDVNAQEILIKQVTLSWFILFASSEQHKYRYIFSIIRDIEKKIVNWR
jgi:hypothetical protein